MKKINRRNFLQKGLLASGVIATSQSIWNSPAYSQSLNSNSKQTSNLPNLGITLQEITVINDPDTRMRVPRGFVVRQIARTGMPVVNQSDYLWHGAPDGGATFATDNGGWIYVSNSELDRGRGGVGAIRFNRDGKIIDSYSILTRTSINCAGGPTPWGTWLSCEEHPNGLVYECDPYGKKQAVSLPMLGAFTHEAAAVDPEHKHIYLTEDVPDGNLYRFTPESYPDGGRADLSMGTLEVAIIAGTNLDQARPVSWRRIPHPVPQLNLTADGSSPMPTRKQVAGAEIFNGGEGCWYFGGMVYFTTKGDNRVWALNTDNNVLDVVYDKNRDGSISPAMNDVDNVTVSTGGDVLIAEDGPEMRLIVFSAEKKPYELVNVLGHRRSEITGPAFSPDGLRLYFSSQRGPAGTRRDGRTYEMTGPFFT